MKTSRLRLIDKEYGRVDLRRLQLRKALIHRTQKTNVMKIQNLFLLLTLLKEFLVKVNTTSLEIVLLV